MSGWVFFTLGISSAYDVSVLMFLCVFPQGASVMLEAPKVEHVKTETAIADADQMWWDPSATCKCNRLMLPGNP